MESNDPILIIKLRDQLVSEMTTHLVFYDETDLERVKTNNWTIKRFLSASKLDLDVALNMAKEAFKWRKSFGINLRNELNFPMEFYKIGSIFPYLDDKEGRPVIYIRIKLYKSFFKYSELIKQFLFHITNKIDIQSQEKGFAMIWDLTGAGPSNWDLSMVRFIITTLRNYFPGGLKYLIPYGVPWIMNTFVNIVIQLLPDESRKKVKFISRDEIFDYIEPNKVPDFMSGLSVVNYKAVPEGVRDLKTMAEELGFSRQEVDNILKYYANELN